MERISSRMAPVKDTPVPEHQCDTCRHFVRLNGQEECHAHPPIGVFMGQGAIGFWPPVMKDPVGRFCGEWDARPIHQNA